MQPVFSEKGFTLLETVIGLGVFMIGLMALVSSVSAARRTSVQAKRETLAQLYATELLEFFASHKTKELQMVGAVASDFRDRMLCAHHNVMDRSTGEIVNPDPVADLPLTSLDGRTSLTRANRFYQVHVVDISLPNVQIDPAVLCDGSLTLGSFDFDANPNRRFMVTVGVTWVPDDNFPLETRRITSSVLLPNL